MAATTETARDLGFLVSEANGSLSRESITVLSGAGSLQPGTVMAKVTASGKYVPYDTDYVDGSGNGDGRETAVGILTHAVDATSADALGTLIVRLAEVQSAALVWHSNNDAGDKTAGLADLAAKYVIAR